MRKKRFFVVLFIILTTFTAVFADDLSDVKQAGVLRFGHSMDYIPFVFEDSNGNITGIDISLMEEVARRMGVSLKPIPFALDGIIDALDLGQIDVIGGGLSKTTERTQKIDFSRTYYSADTQIVCLASYNKPEKVTLDDFRGTKIAVEKGSSYENWIKDNLVTPGYISAADVYSFSHIKDGMKALDNGTVDLAILDEDYFITMFKGTGKYKVFYDGFMTDSYAFGLRKGSTLTSVISGHLDDMIKDGTAQNIANRFFSMNLNELAAAMVTRQEVQPTVVPVVYATAAPSAASCVNGMTFVSDVTVADGQVMNPGQNFTKTWRVKNNGSCTWTTDYTFVLASGNSMGGGSIRIPQTVAPGQTVDLSVNMTAPNTPGTYKGNWQMRSAQGTAFGQVIWVSIRVPGGSTYVQPTAAPKSNDGQTRIIPQINYFYAASDHGYMGDCTTVYWSVDKAGGIEIFVNGMPIENTTNRTGSASVCATIQAVGTHQITLVAHSVTDDASSTIWYTTYDNNRSYGYPTAVPYYGNDYDILNDLTEEDWLALALIAAIAEAEEEGYDWSMWDY